MSTHRTCLVGYKQCLWKVYPGRTSLSLLSQPAPTWDATHRAMQMLEEEMKGPPDPDSWAGVWTGGLAWQSGCLSHHRTSCQPVSHLSLQLLPSDSLSPTLSQSPPVSHPTLSIHYHLESPLTISPSLYSHPDSYHNLFYYVFVLFVNTAHNLR